MKKIFLLPAACLTFLLALVSTAAFAQDDIIMLNNNVVKGQVAEVGVDVIRYHRADNPNGPVYDVAKADVYMIVYANGTSDVINQRSGDNTQASQSDDQPAPVATAPPDMPVYEQPACPTEGYLWTPGYWGYGALGGYYWVPGVWVSPPQVGYLWTPGYWGFNNGYYGWHGGYWGAHIGFYGGVNYGYGYEGSGYYGGRWEGGAFRYNTAVSRVDVTVIHTTYEDRTVIHNNVTVNHASFNGGMGGVKAEPTANERMAMSENHVRVTSEQQNHIAAARSDKSQYVSSNGGKPAVTAMNKPNGEHYTAEGHSTIAHPNTQPVAPHNNNTQPHANQPAQQHTAEPAQQQHNNTPANQPEHTNAPANNNTQQQHTNQPANNNQRPANNNAHNVNKPKPQPAKPVAPRPAPTEKK